MQKYLAQLACSCICANNKEDVLNTEHIILIRYRTLVHIRKEKRAVSLSLITIAAALACNEGGGGADAVISRLFGEESDDEANSSKG